MPTGVGPAADKEDVTVTRQVLIVGAGITGTCMARELAAQEGVSVHVLERDDEQPRGSTTFAPGFVGLYNDAAVLTHLARASAEVYATAGAGIERRGGLELATTEDGAAEAERRVEAARQAGRAPCAPRPSTVVRGS